MDRNFLERRRRNARDDQQLIINTARAEGRKVLSDSEDKVFRSLTETIADLDESLADIERRGEMQNAAANIFNSSRANTGDSPMSPENRALEHLKESGTYNIHNQTGPARRSFLADIYAVSSPGADVHGEASARLASHADEMRNAGLEARTSLDTTVGNAGGFAPPAYMISQYAEYARPAAVTTNLIPQYDLTAPTINIPKITLGTTMSTQSAQNAALTESDIEDEYLTQTAITLGIKEVASRQLLDLAVPGLDAVLFRDLAAGHAAFLDNAILNGTGSPTLTGILQQGGIETIAIPTTGTVTQNLYAGIAQALRYIAVNRYLPATAIVMSPSRWYGLASETDSEGRPLIVASAGGNQAFNAVGTAVNGAPSAGLAGHLLGLPVYTDAQLSDTDILVGRFEDAARYTSGIRLQMSFETLLGQLSALFVCYSYETLFVRYLPSFVLLTDSESVTWGS
jgi:HK97 family phage major capsid protein